MKNPNQSHVSVREGGTSFVGKDAVNLFRAIALRGALEMYARRKMLITRTVTPSSMLVIAKEYTGKTYKRGQHAEAAKDVGVWIETMKAAMPTFVDGEQV